MGHKNIRGFLKYFCSAVTGSVFETGNGNKHTYQTGRERPARGDARQTEVDVGWLQPAGGSPDQCLPIPCANLRDAKDGEFHKLF